MTGHLPHEELVRRLREIASKFTSEAPSLSQIDAVSARQKASDLSQAASTIERLGRKADLLDAVFACAPHTEQLTNGEPYREVGDGLVVPYGEDPWLQGIARNVFIYVLNARSALSSFRSGEGEDE